MKLAAVILDWAGTLVDYGSRAPVEAMQSVFETAGVPIDIAEARGPMGLAKKQHIQEVLNMPRVSEAWRGVHGTVPAPADTDALYADFIPRQSEFLKQHSDLIQGVVGAADRMRSRGLAIGTTTGYTRAMLDYLIVRAAEQGFRPDVAMSPGEVGSGRPAPWMCHRVAAELNLYPMWAMVKIGDTPADVEEGLNAGMWTIGITRTGNEVGFTEEEWERSSTPERNAVLASAEQRLLGAGAHFTTESAADCDGIFDLIQERLDSGEGPWALHAINSSRRA